MKSTEQGVKIAKDWRAQSALVNACGSINRHFSMRECICPRIKHVHE